MYIVECQSTFDESWHKSINVGETYNTEEEAYKAIKDKASRALKYRVVPLKITTDICNLCGEAFANPNHDKYCTGISKTENCTYCGFVGHRAVACPFRVPVKYPEIST